MNRHTTTTKTTRERLELALRALHEQGDALLLTMPRNSLKAQKEGAEKLAKARIEMQLHTAETRVIARISTITGIRLSQLDLDLVLSVGVEHGVVELHDVEKAA